MNKDVMDNNASCIGTMHLTVHSGASDPFRHLVLEAEQLSLALP